MLNLHLVAKQFVLTCLTCGLPAEATESERRSAHIANCSAWANGYDCMHLEDKVPTCKCGEVCSDCGEFMEFDAESDTWDCIPCNFCYVCDQPRIVHGCTAREDWFYLRGLDSSKCGTMHEHGSKHVSCDCVPVLPIGEQDCICECNCKGGE